MKRKLLFAGIAALLVAGGFWFVRSARHANESSAVVGSNTPETHGKRGDVHDARPRLEPPDQTRRFKDFTPEQRVEFARKGQGPGG